MQTCSDELLPIIFWIIQAQSIGGSTVAYRKTQPPLFWILELILKCAATIRIIIVQVLYCSRLRKRSKYNYCTAQYFALHTVPCSVSVISFDRDGHSSQSTTSQYFHASPVFLLYSATLAPMLQTSTHSLPHCPADICWQGSQ